MISLKTHPRIMHRRTLNSFCPTNDGIEDTGHFLLLCHAYDEDRRDLLNSVLILMPGNLCQVNKLIR